MGVQKHPLQNRTNVQIKGGGAKGLLNNVQKNCTFLKWGHPLFNSWNAYCAQFLGCFVLCASRIMGWSGITELPLPPQQQGLFLCRGKTCWALKRRGSVIFFGKWRGTPPSPINFHGIFLGFCLERLLRATSGKSPSNSILINIKSVGLPNE